MWNYIGILQGLLWLYIGDLIFRSSQGSGLAVSGVCELTLYNELASDFLDGVYHVGVI